jgi:uncharacterized protein (DUF362 family)
MSRVALVRGGDRYSNVKQALELLEEEISNGVKDKKKILIKPNFVTVYRQLAATHVDAVRAVLDVVTKYTDQQITIGEGAAEGPTEVGFERYGYYDLKNKYNVRFVDLNKDDAVEADIFDSNLRPMPVKVARTVMESDYRISVAPLKTHDTVIVTLALKNMVVGSLCGVPAMTSIHQGYPAINRSLFKLAQIIPPHLSVIDGFEAMEGEGPAMGTAVDMKVALASTDFLAADTVGSHLMGFDVNDIGYLFYCKEAGLGKGDISQIELVGNASLEECRRKFKWHSTAEAQRGWRLR